MKAFKCKSNFKMYVKNKKYFFIVRMFENGLHIEEKTCVELDRVHTYTDEVKCKIAILMYFKKYFYKKHTYTI